MKTNFIKINDNTKINFLVKQEKELSCPVYIKISDIEGKELLFKNNFLSEDFEFIKLRIPKSTQIIIEVQDYSSILSLEYFVIYDDTVYENGMTYIDISKDKIAVVVHDEMPKHYAENDYRNQFHFSPFKGWLNDPNGLIYFKGYYHMFYQYYPHAPIWGNMHWGHAVSKDLIHWKHFPIALMPSDKLDDKHLGGAFSGNAIEHENKIYLFYTDHFENKKDNSIFIEDQAIATSEDGINFDLHPANPVISERPSKSSKDFRDPKVFKDSDGLWKMILGGAYEGLPSILIYSSKNLISWKFEGLLYQEKKIPGRAIECPDFFQYKNKYVLLMSVFQEFGTEKNYFTRYIVGNFSNNRFEAEYIGLMDFGPDFYATQTFLDNKNRRIGIAWIENWTSQIKSQPHGYSGAMNIPRELYLDCENKLRSKPVDEVTFLRKTEKPFFQKDNFEIFEPETIKGLKGKCLELHIKSCLKTKSEFAIKFRCSENNNEFIKIGYNKSTNKLFIQNKEKVDDNIYKTELKLNENNMLNLVIFLDRSTLEVFANDYKISGTVRMYLDSNNNNIELSASEKTQIETLKAWKLKSCW